MQLHGSEAMRLAVKALKLKVMVRKVHEELNLIEIELNFLLYLSKNRLPEFSSPFHRKWIERDYPVLRTVASH